MNSAAQPGRLDFLLPDGRRHAVPAGEYAALVSSKPWLQRLDAVGAFRDVAHRRSPTSVSELAHRAFILMRVVGLIPRWKAMRYCVIPSLFASHVLRM